MFLWLSLGFIGLIVLWMVCIQALDAWEKQDRQNEQKRPTFTDRLVKYQERDY